MTKEIVASELRRRVTLQAAELTDDTHGGYTRSWTDVAEVWAEIQTLPARERSRETLMGQQLRAKATHRVRMRYRSGVTPDMRLLYGDRALSIISVMNRDEEGALLEMLVEEGNLSES